MQGRLSCLHEQSVLQISDERSDRGKPKVFRGALPVSVTSCYLVLEKVFSQGILRNVTFAFLDS